MTLAILPYGFAVEPVTFIYRAAGSYDPITGAWSSAPDQYSTMRASVQRANGEDIRNLPEGQRADSYYKVYTVTDLQTVDERTGIEPYRVQWQGESWRVVHVDRWQMGTIDHTKVFITRATRNEQGGTNP